ncbi:unnamed protein product [Leptosia nina]|uniref:Uncharacterized protein n=1 Tax=Leptosia nina TaxID=320188 RepID=A0AAV1JPS2_9NEOP
MGYSKRTPNGKRIQKAARSSHRWVGRLKGGWKLLEYSKRAVCPAALTTVGSAAVAKGMPYELVAFRAPTRLIFTEAHHLPIPELKHGNQFAPFASSLYHSGHGTSKQLHENAPLPYLPWGTAVSLAPLDRAVAASLTKRHCVAHCVAALREFE